MRYLKAILFLFIAHWTTNDLAWKKKVCGLIGHASPVRSFPAIPGDYRMECGRCTGHRHLPREMTELKMVWPGAVR